MASKGTSRPVPASQTPGLQNCGRERERVCSCRQSGALFGPPPDTRADLAGRPRAWVCLAARRGSCRFKTNHSPSGPRRRCVEFLAKNRLVLFAPQLPALMPCLPVLGAAPPRKLPGSDFSSPLGRSPGPSTAAAGRMEASGACRGVVWPLVSGPSAFLPHEADHGPKGGDGVRGREKPCPLRRTRGPGPGQGGALALSGGRQGARGEPSPPACLLLGTCLCTPVFPESITVLQAVRSPSDEGLPGAHAAILYPPCCH